MRDRMKRSFEWLTDRGIKYSFANMDNWWDDPSIIAGVGRMLASLFRDVANPTAIIAPAASGYMLGPLVALEFRARFVGATKEVGTSMTSDRWLSTTTPPDYRDRHLSIGWRRGRISSGDRVLAVDDIIDTGGQLLAIKSGVERSGAEWLGAAVLIDALENGGRRRDLGVRSIFNSREL
ncbi:phosphoribosyltransferase family protein [Nakamurella lactea]|uniref:phosphoribosyltransferase family protein n=1 Tax=Nakamurella lactea TaxID=459515 RepID=UPI001B7FA610|nr:phosphoribosyltransferase family protein [Nakamurella lactea]